MKCSAIVSAITLLVVTNLLAGEERQPRLGSKAAWEWTLEERIAARSDAALARERVERHRASERGSEISLKSASRRSENSHLVDVIDGKRNPELFLPHELFEDLIRMGFVGDTWRDFYVDRIPAAGLPKDFWERLERIAPDYIDVMLKRHQLIEGGRNATAAEQEALREAQRALQTDLCRERADALARAQKEFGPALDHLLYEYIARTRAVFAPFVFDRELLSFQARGCR